MLECAAVYHPDPRLQPLLDRAMASRYRFGEPNPGRVWEAKTGLLIPELDFHHLADTLQPASRGLIREVQVRSLMVVPIFREQQVIGTLGAYRGPCQPAYAEADYCRLQAWAARLDSEGDQGVAVAGQNPDDGPHVLK